MQTAIQKAFLNSKVCDGVQLELLERVGNTYDAVTSKPSKEQGWKAELSSKTIRQLTSEGIFS